MKRKLERAKFQAQRGFTLIEVSLTLIIFLMMTLMFAAVFPFAIRGAEHSTNYSQAVLIAQHKVDQIKAAGFSHLDYTDLSGLGIVDAVPSSSPYSFTGVDDLDAGISTNGFFPPGSTGTITIVDYSTINAAVPSGVIDYVTVNIKWAGSGISAGSYQVATLIKSS
jgi:prepilin-type N-terminal cleavage/methylation domain-containing protein